MDQGISSEEGLIRALASLILEALSEAQFASYRNVFSEKLGSNPMLDTLLPGHSRQLRALWGFADTYFDAYAHGFSEADSLPLADAGRLLRQAAEQVLSGGEINSPEVLRYADLYR